MTYCFRCGECAVTYEFERREAHLCPRCGSVLYRDYKAEASYVSVKARPSSRKRHWGKWISR